MQENTIVSLKNAAIYQGKTLILNDINITISKGEFSYLIGKTGSGKSSLLKALYGALPLEAGEGSVDVGFAFHRHTEFNQALLEGIAATELAQHDLVG